MISIPKGTTVTMPAEAHALAVCECMNQSPDDELYASVPDDGTGRGLVVMLRDGEVTNRYADGLVGVTEGDRTMADIDEEPYCPECESYVRGWIHTA